MPASVREAGPPRSAAEAIWGQRLAGAISVHWCEISRQSADFAPVSRGGGRAELAFQRLQDVAGHLVLVLVGVDDVQQAALAVVVDQRPSGFVEYPQPVLDRLRVVV